MEPIHPKFKLSALWLFILINIIFRDIHQFTLKSHLEMLLTGFYNGMEVTDTIMLLGGMVLEIPIALVVFSLLLKRKFNRPANIAGAIILSLLMLVEAPSDMDDVFFRIVEMLGIAAIIWTAWKWPERGPDDLAGLREASGMADPARSARWKKQAILRTKTSQDRQRYSQRYL